MTEIKIPIENIYYLLCYAWNQLDEAGRIKVSASDYTKYIDLFAKALKNACAYIFKRGLDREYLYECGELTRLKGKIDFCKNMKNMIGSSSTLYCEYDDLSNNVLHNQIIKSTINKVLRIRDLDPAIRKDLIEIYKRMMQVSDINLDRNHFKKVRLHRNNLFYRFVLNIAYLIHENIVLDEKTGNYEFIDFIRDDRKMASLFENFVRNFYKEHLKGTDYDVKPEIIKWNVTESDPFSLEYLPQMKTDISITSEKRKIIIDTKYYRECLQEYYNKETFISSNLYQLFTYVKNAEAQGGSAINCEGILIYPTVRKEIDKSYSMENHKISVKTINLNQGWKNISNDLMKIIN
ncbi:MAG: 5-methylcytosine-specific restriction endonuclease system specificity protein McrC [Nanoarchaeota archaeon]|nr:5-methylcytosine-specific restriction endonuclease system specificity protein McrC [Nanoarchaeota archaeon]